MIEDLLSSAGVQTAKHSLPCLGSLTSKATLQVRYQDRRRKRTLHLLQRVHSNQSHIQSTTDMTGFLCAAAEQLSFLALSLVQLNWLSTSQNTRLATLMFQILPVFILLSFDKPNKATCSLSRPLFYQTQLPTPPVISDNFLAQLADCSECPQFPAHQHPNKSQVNSLNKVSTSELDKLFAIWYAASCTSDIWFSALSLACANFSQLLTDRLPCKRALSATVATNSSTRLMSLLPETLPHFCSSIMDVVLFYFINWLQFQKDHISQIFLT